MRTSLSPRQWKSWRDVLSIHPAAELFPLMSPDELKALSEDIKKNGIQMPITIMAHCVNGEWLYQLLDGRNRLDAIELTGFNPTTPKRSRGHAKRRKLGIDCGLDPFLGLPDENAAINYIPPPDDPYAVVASFNIHRRHLSAEQKRELIGKLLAAAPEKSDRQVAETIKADHKTVGSVRAEMEGRGEIPHVAERRDTKGRKQPAKRVYTLGMHRAAKLGGDVMVTLKGTSLGNAAKMDELIGLRVRNEELERENLALRSEIEELKAELAKRAPINDGLDISACLRRAAPAPAAERAAE